MRNFFIFLLLTFVCSVILYFTGHSILQSSFESRIKSIPEELEKHGIIIDPLSLENIKVNSSKSLSITNIKTRLNFAKKRYYSPNESFNFRIGELVIEAQDYSFKKLKLTVNDVTLQSIQDDNIEGSYIESIDSYDTLKFQFISTEFDNNNSNPEQATRALLDRLNNYLKNGSLDVPIKFAGGVVLSGDEYLKLSFDKDFYINKTEFTKLPNGLFNQPEIDFLSTHPLRVGTFYELKQQKDEFFTKVDESANPLAVKTIYYIINLKSKFGEEMNFIADACGTDEATKFYIEMAHEYLSKGVDKSALIKLINKQGKNFPIKAKANYSVN